MQGQDDVDIIHGTSVGGRLTLATGDKGSEINLADLTVKQLDIQTGKGNDQLVLSDVTVNGSTQIKTDKGDSKITIDDSTFGGALSLKSIQGQTDVDVIDATSVSGRVDPGHR